jgi:hypothetical protein
MGVVYIVYINFSVVDIKLDGAEICLLMDNRPAIFGQAFINIKTRSEKRWRGVDQRKSVF